MYSVPAKEDMGEEQKLTEDVFVKISNGDNGEYSVIKSATTK